MAEPSPGPAKPFDLQKGLQIAATVAGLLAPAALFYGAGYVITQAYVVTVGLNGTFWFNEFFYREAGARFALDVLAALVLLPHVVLLLGLTLYLYLPTPGAGHWRDQLLGGQAVSLGSALPSLRLPGFLSPASRRQRLQVFMAIVVLAVAALGGVTHFAAESGEAGVPVLAAWTTNHLQWFFADYLFLPQVIRERFFDAKPMLYPTAMLLAVAVPLLVAFVALAVRAWRGARDDVAAASPAGPFERQLRHGQALLWLLASLMLGSYTVVAYGGFFYDFYAMPVLDKHKCLPVTKEAERAIDKQDLPVLGCFLVGRFDKWYMLLGWEKTDEQTVQPPIYVKQVDVLEPFSILTSPGVPVRGILRLQEDYLELSLATKPAGGKEPAADPGDTAPVPPQARPEPARSRP